MMKKIREFPLFTHFVIRTALMISGSVVALIAQPSSRDGMNIGMVIGLILMIAGILWHIFFVRCPHCGTLLRLRGGIPKYCPDCGKHIE